MVLVTGSLLLILQLLALKRLGLGFIRSRTGTVLFLQAVPIKVTSPDLVPLIALSGLVL